MFLQAPFWPTFDFATQYGFEVEKRLLSRPYGLPNGTRLEGEILEIDIMGAILEEDLKSFERVKNIFKTFKVDFFLLETSYNNDLLLLSKESWSILRDYAIIPNGYIFDIKIISAHVDDEKIDIYPNRDLIIEI